MSKEKLAGEDEPDWNVCSSPFAVTAYRVHDDFGGNDALEHFRDELAARGVRLVRSRAAPGSWQHSGCSS